MGKEVTTIMTVQLTSIGTLTEEQYAFYQANIDKINKIFLGQLKKDCDLDDVLLLEHKHFVLEKAEENTENR